MKRDRNERAIVDALRAAGYSVVHLDHPCDLLVGRGGRTYCLEVKLPLGPRGGAGGKRQTVAQRMFATAWRGHYEVVRSPEEALRACGDHFHEESER